MFVEARRVKSLRRRDHAGPSSAGRRAAAGSTANAVNSSDVRGRRSVGQAHQLDDRIPGRQAAPAARTGTATSPRTFHTSSRSRTVPRKRCEECLSTLSCRFLLTGAVCSQSRRCPRHPAACLSVNGPHHTKIQPLDSGGETRGTTEEPKQRWGRGWRASCCGHAARGLAWRSACSSPKSPSSSAQPLRISLEVALTLSGRARRKPLHIFR